MKRWVIVIVVASFFVMLGRPPAVASQPADCTKGDVEFLAKSGQVGGRQFLSGYHTGPADAWENCQFRLYDDESAQVFTVDDYFLAGIFLFDSYYVFERPEYDRAAAIEWIRSASHRFFLGPVDLADAELPEIALTQGAFRDVRLLDEYGGHVVTQHTYAIFAPGSLAPGEYRWRYEFQDPFESFVAQGTLTILSS